MAEAESLKQVAQGRAPFSAWFGTLLLFMLFGIIVFALVGPSDRTDQYEQTRAKKRYDILKGVKDEEARALNSYAWVDKAKGSARIPIDRAMELTVTDLARKKPAPAYPVATPPPPAAAASPAAAPSAAPGAASPSPAAAAPQSENRAQPAGAANPPGVKPATQPGAAATPQASPAPPSGKPAASPSSTPSQASHSPLPVAGQTPTPH